MYFSKATRRATACELKRLIETTQALETRIGRDFDNRIIRCDEKPLRMGYAVFGEEIGDGGAECLAEERHCIVWVKTGGGGNSPGSQRLVVMPRDVARESIGATQLRARLEAGQHRMRGIGLAHGQGESQAQESRLDFQLRHAFVNHVAGVQIRHPLT